MPNVLVVFAAAATLTAAVSATAQEAAAPPATVELTADQIAHDPRMIAAVRHANSAADRKCGDSIGGFDSLEVKAQARACRKRMVDVAKLDAEGDITRH